MILVWGAGAIGGSLAAAFLRVGHEVLLVDADAAHVEAINANGLVIDGPIAPGTVPARAVTPDAVTGTHETIILAVKAHHTEAATRALARHLSAEGTVVSAQNGLNERVIAAILGSRHVVGAFVNFGADVVAPGVVHYGGRGAVVVGEMDGSTTERVRRLHALFRSFDAAALLSDNIEGYLWGKMVYGALLFATALTDDSIADVLDDPAARPLLTRLGNEVAAVASAEGVRMEAFDGFDPGAFLPGADPARTRRSFDDMVAHNRRSLKSHSGIWRDLAVRKRKTEVDAQLGPVAEIGRARGVPTPLTERVVALIHEIEEGTRPLSRANVAAVEAA
jgi:2-dehydropantoate 2-reductase